MITADMLREYARESYEDLVSTYHDLHRIPEISLKEYQTTQYIKDRLTSLGIEPLTCDETGCAAVIGRDAGRTIALRADIDALPVAEESGLPFSSCHEGLMHACGHDGHTASLLAAAKILKQLEQDLPCRVKLIFQASEENTYGAKRLIDRGILDDVDEIFGLHLFSDMPAGTISIEEGPRMAQTDRFEITFTGRGGHAAKPHLTVDATLMAAQFVTDLQSLVAREMDPTEGAVATVASLHSGTQYNVISDKAVLEGTCRCYSGRISAKLEEGIRRRAEATARMMRGNVQVTYKSTCHPPVDNDPALTGRILESARGILGPGKFVKARPLMLGEDFSWYQTVVPGVFAFVGCGVPGRENAPNHHPAFTIYEPVLVDAVKLHLAAVFSG